MGEQKAGVLDAETDENPGQNAKNNQNDDSAGNNNRQQENQEKKKPNAAEIITFIVSLLIVLAVVGTVIFMMLTESGKPAAISVTPEIGNVRQQDGMYYVPIKVENKGGLGAEAVLIRVTLEGDGNGEKTESEFTVDFLAGGASADGVAIFRENPSGKNLTAECISYLKP
jgi:uncharacterized protein (TIGR02588 family)